MDGGHGIGPFGGVGGAEGESRSQRLARILRSRELAQSALARAARSPVDEYAALLPQEVGDRAWPLFDSKGCQTDARTVTFQDWGRLMTARWFAPLLADHLDCPVGHVLWVLDVVAIDASHLFDSAGGWASVGCCVKVALRMPDPDGCGFKVTLH